MSVQALKYHGSKGHRYLTVAQISAGFRDQLDRAALSVSNNIAEGFERKSNKELSQFLVIARGSLGEVRSMVGVMLLRKNPNILSTELNDIKISASSCSKQITAWLVSLEFQPSRPKSTHRQ